MAPSHPDSPAPLAAAARRPGPPPEAPDEGPGPDGLRTEPLPWPAVRELEVVRHFTRLSRDSYGVDNGIYPLGSCTMKGSPKLNDHLANLDGFRAIHPLQPPATFQGLLALLHELQDQVGELLGMDCVSLQPAAGAQAELAGALIMRKHFEQAGQDRDTILVAESSHGTNPASATMAGYRCETVATGPEGRLELQDLQRKMGPHVAGLMLTNPSTFGIFETGIEAIAATIHAHGALLYYDGANLNALMGIARPGDMGFDLAHMNVHKTLSTPHGGGGPGAGPIGVKAHLAAHLPRPRVETAPDGTYRLGTAGPASIGRMKSGFGHVGVLIRAYCYLLAQGADGLREASQRAVLNANYLKARLAPCFPAVHPSPSLHECLVSLGGLATTAERFASRLVAHGIHPPSLVGGGCVYYDDALRDAFLIEPTETESQADLDRFVAIMRAVRRECLDGTEPPHHPARRAHPEGDRPC